MIDLDRMKHLDEKKTIFLRTHLYWKFKNSVAQLNQLSSTILKRSVQLNDFSNRSVQLFKKMENLQL